MSTNDATFDRFDICEAYAVLEWDYNLGGWLHERPTNRKRMEATSILARLRFRPRLDLSFETLTENGQAIFRNLERRYGFTHAEHDGTKYWPNCIASRGQDEG
jgi:hypothetical protein